MIAEIEVARLQVDLMAHKEELWHQEEAWSHELADLATNQKAILADLKKTKIEIETSQVSISQARETIAKPQAIFESNQAKFEKTLKRREELILQQGQLHQERTVRTWAIEEAKAQVS